MNSELTKIFIPKSLIEIDPQPFTGCSSIATIEIDKNNPVYSVAEPATLMDKAQTKIFYVSPAIESINIVMSVKTISSTLLQSCTSLKDVLVSSESTTYSSSKGILYDKAQTKAIACAGGIKDAVIVSTCKTIESYCFYSMINLQSVSIPEGVINVLSYAFSKTTNLKNITFPSSLESINDYAFYQSSIDHIRFHGDGPKEIKNSCFQYSSIKSIHFGRNLKTVSSFSFHTCSEMFEIKFDEDCMLSTITTECFVNCYKLTNFVIPRNVLTIQETAFSGCNSMKNVTFLKGSKINTIKKLAFANCAIKEIYLPESITFLDGSIWVGNKELTKLTFDLNIKLNQIGPGDFIDCVKLTEVIIPASIIYFDPSVFSGCTSLVEVNVNESNNNYKSIEGIVYTFDCSRLVACPCGRIEATVMQKVATIGSNAFYLCKKLSNLIFEKDCKLERIEEGTFFSCIELRRVDLPTSLMTVERNAFYGCTKLETITFPDHSLCNLDHESVFAGCESLKDITFGRFCALTVFGQSTFSGCTKIEQITIPANCTTIGNNCFENCAPLSNIVFEKGSEMQRVGDNAFIGCKSLVNYTIPDKSAYISNDMFGNAPSIINIIIPENTKLSSIQTNAFNNMNIESINFCKGSTVDVIENSAFMSKQIKTFSIECPIIISSNAFMNCFNLTSINIPKATQIGNNAFSNCYKLSKLIIPDTCTSFGEHSFENCTSLIEVGMNRISKLTTMSDFCFCQCCNLISVTIPETVQYLGSFSFAKCKKLKTATFNSPSSLKTFGMYIFLECESLINFTIPDSINSITNKIFGNAPSIKNIFVPDEMKIEKITSTAFNNIDMKTITFGQGTTIGTIENSCFENKKIENVEIILTQKVGSNVFRNCKNLKKASINFVPRANNVLRLNRDSVLSSVPKGIFDGCTNLVSFNTISIINTIDDYAFRNCMNLLYIVPSSVTRIGSNAFENCRKIFNIPSMVQYIGNRSYFGTDIKMTIKIPSSVTFIGSDSFTSTKARNIFYCGTNDFSQFSQAFNFASNILVTNDYPSNIFCSNHVYKSDSCYANEITGIYSNTLFSLEVFICPIFTT